jgi:hypothetical protein
MAFLKFLTDVSLLITVGVDAIVLCHVFPAFRRTKNRAFLCIAIASVLGIVISVYDHTVIPRGASQDAYVLTRILRRFAYFTDCIFWCVGIVMLTRPYLYGSAHPDSRGLTDTQPSASPNGGPAEPLSSSGVGGGPPSVS